MFMSFSGTSRIQMLKGETLAQKIRSINMNDWANNTNLQAAFRHVLEIGYCGGRNWTFYEKMAQRFRNCGYQIPNIIFWNVASRRDVFHADRTVPLSSGLNKI